MQEDVIGRINSTETFPNGNGLNFVVFLQGCPLRCLYCNSPDTWLSSEGKNVMASELIKEILSLKNDIMQGGVTLSGGEPLMQPEFCLEIIDACHQNSINVAIDTSGAVPLIYTEDVISEADMLLLDIKDINPNDCETLTGMSNENCLDTLEFCEVIKKPVWLRHVILPHYTLDDEKLYAMGEYLKDFKCIKKVELVPYHTVSKYKWESLGLDSKLKNEVPPTSEQLIHASKILQKYNLPL